MKKDFFFSDSSISFSNEKFKINYFRLFTKIVSNIFPDNWQLSKDESLKAKGSLSFITLKIIIIIFLMQCSNEK